MPPTSCSRRWTPPRARCGWASRPGSASLSDTVGFIRDLPHKLVEAFEATLQEAAEADLLLHVMDVSSPQQQEQRDEVQRVLAEIGAGDIPQVWVCNKVDQLDESQQPRESADWILGEGGRRFRRVFVSARDGTGLDALRQAMADAALDRLNPTLPAPDADPTEGHPLDHPVSHHA